MSKYDDGTFHGGQVRRWDVGRTQKHGGADAVITFNESEATKVTRWYPKGPIRVKKLGVYVAGTLGKGEEMFVFSVNGTRITTSTTGSPNGVVVASTTAAPYTISSKTCDKVIAAGSYLSVLASTNVCSTGSVALFVDYVPVYQYGKWD